MLLYGICETDLRDVDVYTKEFLKIFPTKNSRAKDLQVTNKISEVAMVGLLGWL